MSDDDSDSNWSLGTKHLKFQLMTRVPLGLAGDKVPPVSKETFSVYGTANVSCDQWPTYFTWWLKYFHRQSRDGTINPPQNGPHSPSKMDEAQDDLSTDVKRPQAPVVPAFPPSLAQWRPASDEVMVTRAWCEPWGPAQPVRGKWLDVRRDGYEMDRRPTITQSSVRKWN